MALKIIIFFALCNLFFQMYICQKNEQNGIDVVGIVQHQAEGFLRAVNQRIYDFAHPEQNSGSLSFAEVKPHSMPYYVLLQVKDNNRIRTCGGALISKKFVLANDLCEFSNKKINIVLGAHNVTTDESTQVKREGRVKKHFQFSSVALVELSEETPINENIQLAKLPSRSDLPNSFAGLKANLTEWDPKSVLTFGEGTILDDNECNEVPFAIKNPKKVGCWRTRFKNLTISQNAGSLVLIDSKIIGVVYFLNTRSPEKIVSFWKLTGLLEWIENHSDAKIYKNSVTLVEAKPHSIPYQVWLEIRNSNNIAKVCEGSLISKKFVLSAAQCILESRNITVILGAHNISMEEPTQIKREGIARLLVRSNKINSIAIIELTQETPINENIRVAKLPSIADLINSFSGAKATWSGWGPTHVLAYVEGKILDQSECKKTFAFVSDSVICWSAEFVSDFCYRGLGSTLTVEGKIIALAVFEEDICLSGTPVRFIRVNRLLDWIEEHTDVIIDKYT